MPAKNTFSGKPFAGSSVLWKPNTNEGIGATQTCKYDYTFGWSITSPRFVFSNTFFNGNGESPSSISAVTINAAAVEYPAGSGNLYQFNFNGSASASLNPSDWWETDPNPVRIAGTGPATLASVASGQVGRFFVSLTGTTWPTDSQPAAPYGNGNNCPGNHALDFGGTYDGFGRTFSHVAVTGDVVGGHVPSVMILGDSISGINSGNGYEATALAAGGKIYVGCPNPGEAAQSFATASTVRVAFANYADFRIFAYGTNDNRNRRTISQVQANFASCLALLTNANGTDLCTIPPLTASSDNWATVNNQSNIVDGSGFDYYGNRRAINNMMLATPAMTGVRKVWNTGDKAASSLGADTWPAAGTTDGVHPVQSGSNAMGTAIVTSSYVTPGPIAPVIEATQTALSDAIKMIVAVPNAVTYNLFANGVQVASQAASGITSFPYTFAPQPSGTSVAYYVVAVDASGNASANSNVQTLSNTLQRCTLTFTDPVRNTPIAAATVYVSSDALGRTLVAGPMTTNASGQAVAMLAGGTGYYLFMNDGGENSITGQYFIAVAD